MVTHIYPLASLKIVNVKFILFYYYNSLTLCINLYINISINLRYKYNYFRLERQRDNVEIIKILR